MTGLLFLGVGEANYNLFMAGRPPAPTWEFQSDKFDFQDLKRTNKNSPMKSRKNI